MNHITLALELLEIIGGGRTAFARRRDLETKLRVLQGAQLDQDDTQNDGINMLAGRVRAIERRLDALGQQQADLRDKDDELQELLEGTVERLGDAGL